MHYIDKKINIFNIDKSNQDSFFMDLGNINYAVLNKQEKDKFLPLFFINQFEMKIS